MSAYAHSLSSADVVRHAGCTYRQLDWWARKGAVTPSYGGGGSSGDHRRWSPVDADAIAAITRVSAGFVAIGSVMPSAVAAEVWRAFHDDPDVRELRLGILTVDLRGRVS